MKKALAILTVLLLCIALCGCSFSKGRIYDHADQYSVGSFTCDASAVRKIAVRWESGELRVRESEGALLSASEKAEGLSADQQMHWWLDGGTLRVEFCQSGYSGSIGGEKQLEMEIPRGVDFEAEVSSGRVVLGDHQFGALRLASSSGSLKMGNIRAESVTLAATSGSITAGLTDVKGALCVASTSGSIAIEAVQAQSLEAAATSGSIRLGLYRCGGASISATSGSVRLTVHPNYGAAIDYTTSSSSVNGENVRSGRLVLGDGSCPVKVSTTSGNLTAEMK